MMKLFTSVLGTMLCVGQAWAVPALQIGAPAGPDDTGIYADYLPVLSNPTEEDTALTTGNVLYIAGAYQSANVAHLGGGHGNTDWGDVFNDLSVFNGRGAILMASIPDGFSGSLDIEVDGSPVSPFLSSPTNIFQPSHHGAGNEHDPVKDNISDFLYFDIGSFAKVIPIPDFDDESVGTQEGQIKDVNLIVADYPWLHFDVFALQHSDPGVTLVKFNPPSHDVTWKDDTPDDPSDEDPGDANPEPASGVLAAMALAVLAGRYRR